MCASVFRLIWLNKNNCSSVSSQEEQKVVCSMCTTQKCTCGINPTIMLDMFVLLMSSLWFLPSPSCYGVGMMSTKTRVIVVFTYCKTNCQNYRAFIKFNLFSSTILSLQSGFKLLIMYLIIISITLSIIPTFMTSYLQTN